MKGSARLDHLSIGIEYQGMAPVGAEQIQTPEAGVCIGEYGAAEFEDIDFDPFDR